MHRVRPYTWLLVFLLSLTAVLGSQLRRGEPRLMHVADGPPPVEAPVGALLDAYETARAATVRIEGRCGPGRGVTTGVGSGFFVSESGLLLTAYHVIDTSNSSCAVRYVAIDSTEEEFALSLVGFDVYMDVAALQADVDRLVPALPLSTSVPNPGSEVVAIGNSRGDFLAARAGHVTRVGVRAGRADFASGTIELTNSLAPGDSGGPVVNARGQAVAVVSYISFNPSAMSSQDWIPPYLRGIVLPSAFASYAVPVIDDSELVNGILAGDMRDVPVIGFSWPQGFDYDPRTSQVFLGPRPGTIVGEVAAGGPAAAAGLRSFSQSRVVRGDGTVAFETTADVIVAIDGEPTATFADLLAIVREKAIGQTVTLTVQRGNGTFEIELTLGAKRAVFVGG
jgi:S1-C subfamily serine protease